MAWEVKSQHVDKALGQHIIHLHEPETKADHIVQIIIGQHSCPLCGHVRVVSNAGEMNPREIIESEVAALEIAHAQSHEYARKHRIPLAK